MRSLLRLLPVVIALALLASILVRGGLSALALFDPRTLGFVLLVPWLALALMDAPAAPFSALGDALIGDAADLPSARRRLDARRLRSLANTTLATGIIAACSAGIGALNAVASTGGQGNPASMAGAMGGMLLGPVYGLVLAGLFYSPLALQLEQDDSGLGEELEG